MLDCEFKCLQQGIQFLLQIRCQRSKAEASAEKQRLPWLVASASMCQSPKKFLHCIKPIIFFSNNYFAENFLDVISQQCCVYLCC